MVSFKVYLPNNNIFALVPTLPFKLSLVGAITGLFLWEEIFGRHKAAWALIGCPWPGTPHVVLLMLFEHIHRFIR